jgi:hypothetical protein
MTPLDKLRAEVQWFKDEAHEYDAGTIIEFGASFTDRLLKAAEWIDAIPHDADRYGECFHGCLRCSAPCGAILSVLAGGDDAE